MSPLDGAPPATVLLVDDRPANLLALEALLAPLGQRLVRAASGDEALARAAVEPPALVLMDVNMPGRDGFDTVAQLRRQARTRDVPVIFITAVHDDRDYAARGYALDAVDYLTKPFEPEVLVAKVRWFVTLWQRGELVRAQAELLRRREREAARAEAARQAAEEASRAKDEFLAMVSHELRTPLTALVGWLEMLQKGLVEPEQLESVYTTLVRCTLAQSQLVDDLLDVSRIVAGKLVLERGRVDLAAVVEEARAVVAPMARERQIEVVAACAGPSWLEGDAQRLQQVVANLFVNAIKFSRRGGRVEATLSTAAGEHTLRVRDWGVGIAPALLPHVFERFRQGASARGRGGLGLGLAIARHLVELHGGRIDAASAGEGQGATLTVRLPAT